MRPLVRIIPALQRVLEKGPCQKEVHKIATGGCTDQEYSKLLASIKFNPNLKKAIETKMVQCREAAYMYRRNEKNPAMDKMTKDGWCDFRTAMNHLLMAINDAERGDYHKVV